MQRGVYSDFDVTMPGTSFPTVVGIDISPALVRSANARSAAQVARPPGAKPFAHRPRLERHWTIGVQSCRYSHHVMLSNVSSLISPRPPCIFDLGDVQVTS